MYQQGFRTYFHYGSYNIIIQYACMLLINMVCSLIGLWFNSRFKKSSSDEVRTEKLAIEVKVHLQCYLKAVMTPFIWPKKY